MNINASVDMEEGKEANQKKGKGKKEAIRNAGPNGFFSPTKFTVVSSEPNFKYLTPNLPVFSLFKLACQKGWSRS